jgi:hypothetical protein
MYTWLLAGNYAAPGQGTETRMEVPGGLRASDVGNRMHVDHCIETLRKALMCHGDVTPFLGMYILDNYCPLLNSVGVMTWQRGCSWIYTDPETYCSHRRFTITTRT